MPPLLRFARYHEIAKELAGLCSREDPPGIIVASGGLAAGATAELLTQTAAGAASLRFSTLEQFARLLLNENGQYPRPASEAERRLAMRVAGRSIDDPMMETRGIGAMLERSYRDLRDGGMTLDDFERRARAADGLRNRTRTEMLLRSWRRYEELIATLQAVDSADVLARAAGMIERGEADVPPQVVAGFYDMTGAQLRLLKALAKAGKLTAIYVPVGEGEAYAFANRFVKQIASVLSPQSSVLAIKAASTTFTQYDNKESELRAICAAVRELLDRGVAARSIGIVSRSIDPDDVRLLARFAGDLNFEISTRTESPLLAHRVARGVAAIIHLRRRNFRRTDVIDILRDGFRPRTHVNIDWLDMETRRARGASIAEYRTLIEDLESVAPSPHPLSGAAWASVITRAAERFRLESELDLEAAAALDDVAALLRRADRWKQPIDADTVIDLMEQPGIRGPAKASSSPCIWTGDVMSFRGRSFEHLFVVRMQEGAFPQRRVDDPLLPDSDRRQLGLREIGDGRDEERLLFQLLLDGTGTSIHFSLAGSDGFGKVLRPSPFVKRAQSVDKVCGSQKTPTTKNLTSIRRQVQLLARAGTHSIFDGYLFADSESEAIRSLVANKLQSISPTQLEDYGECPQKFLFKHILGVVDYDDPERDLQLRPREKGKLDHGVLERLYRTLDDAALRQAQWFLPQISPELRERVDKIIDAAFDDEEARVPAFNPLMRQIERRATKRNLHAFLAEDLADLLQNDLRPRHFEYKFGEKYARRGEVDHPDPFTFDAHGIPMRVEGSIDRIDAGPDKLRIVDYKSGKALRHVNLQDKIDRGVRLQLALYGLAVSEFFGLAAHAISGAIKPLVVRGADPDKMTFNLGEREEQLRETLDLFVRSMLGGAFPAFPNESDNDFNSCKYCPVNLACRTKHAEAERRHVIRHKDPRTLLESM